MTGWKIFQKEIKQISCGSATNVWGIGIDDKIYQFSNGNWNEIINPKRMINNVETSVTLQCVSVASDGTVWGIDVNNYIFKRVGNEWNLISGKLSQLSVGSNDVVWGVGVLINDKYNIYRYGAEGTAPWGNPIDSGDVNQLSVGSDGTVWGIDTYGMVCRRFNNQWNYITVDTEPDPQKPDEEKAIPLSHISVGSGNDVWVIAKNSNHFYKYPGNDSDLWIKIPNEEILVQISVGNDEIIWGVNSTNNVFCNYYLEHSNLLVSALGITEIRLEQGDEAYFEFNVTNISSGATLEELKLYLDFNRDEFTAKHVTIETNDPDNTPDKSIIIPPTTSLGPGMTETCGFTIKADDTANVETYWLKSISATYTIAEQLIPIPLPVENEIKGYINFDVVTD